MSDYFAGSIISVENQSVWLWAGDKRMVPEESYSHMFFFVYLRLFICLIWFFRLSQEYSKNRKELAFWICFHFDSVMGLTIAFGGKD